MAMEQFTIFAPRSNISALFRRLAAAGLVSQHEADQTVHHARVGAGAAHRDVGDDAHVALTDDLHKLHDGVTVSAEGLDARAIGFRFGVAGGADGFGIAHGAQSSGFGFARGVLDVGAGMQFGNADALLGPDDLLLDIGQWGFAEQAAAAVSARLPALRRSCAVPPRSCGRSASPSVARAD